ncbi:MAG: deoxyribose-phosphate aldolase [Clostridia bacterium]|nr:MAG: deoxyribose-phosphate aldolase [Clostridia bacterium]
MDPLVNLAAYIDHTLLRPEAGPGEVAGLADEARDWAFHAVCVQPVYVELAVRLLQDSGVAVCTVIDFPHGASPTRVRAFAAREAVRQGATEIDVVMPIGLFLAGEYGRVEEDLRLIFSTARGAAAGPVTVKVILETGFLSDLQKQEAARLAVAAGADFVKTSTGFGPGGARVEDVRLLAAAVAGRAQVKASGGIRNLETALAMLEAGATRLGTSSGVAIMKEWQAGVVNAAGSERGKE